MFVVLFISDFNKKLTKHCFLKGNHDFPLGNNDFLSL